jgi:hypothetical protein
MTTVKRCVTFPLISFLLASLVFMLVVAPAHAERGARELFRPQSVSHFKVACWSPFAGMLEGAAQ